MAEKTRAVIIAEYSIVKLFQWAILLMPWFLARRFGSILGRISYYLIYKRTRLVKENLKYAFPEKSEAEIRDLSLKVWKNLGQTVVEFIKIPQINKKNLDKYITLRGFENIDKALARKKGVIFLVAHYFSWEMVAMAVSMKGYPLSVIIRPIKNPLIDRLTVAIREFSGTKAIYHRKAIREGMKVLKKNGTLGILLDQHYGGDVEVDFFKRKVGTSPIISLFAGRLGSAVIPIRNWREGDRIIAEAYPEVELPEFKTGEQYNRETTQIFTSIIEDWVREKPEGWFWVHRRWR